MKEVLNHDNSIGDFFDHISLAIPEKSKILISTYEDNDYAKIQNHVLKEYKKYIQESSKSFALIEDIFENNLLRNRKKNNEKTNKILTNWKNHLKNYIIGSASLLADLIEHLKKNRLRGILHKHFCGNY